MNKPVMLSMSYPTWEDQLSGAMEMRIKFSEIKPLNEPGLLPRGVEIQREQKDYLHAWVYHRTAKILALYPDRRTCKLFLTKEGVPDYELLQNLIIPLMSNFSTHPEVKAQSLKKTLRQVVVGWKKKGLTPTVEEHLESRLTDVIDSLFLNCDHKPKVAIATW